MQSFPRAPAAPMPDEDAGDVMPPPRRATLPQSCTCVRCDEANAADESLIRVAVSRVTIVREYKTPTSEPTVKAYVATESGRIGVGNGHSDEQAIFDGLRGLTGDVR